MGTLNHGANPDRVYAGHADPNRLTQFEVDVADVIYTFQNGTGQFRGRLDNRDEHQPLTEAECDELGQHILKRILKQFRPDLLQDAPNPHDVVTVEKWASGLKHMISLGTTRDAQGRVRVQDAIHPERFGWAALTEVMWDGE